MLFEKLKTKLLQAKKTIRIVIAKAEDEELFLALKQLIKEGLVLPILVGDKKKINQLAKKTKLNNFTIIDAQDDQDVAKKAVQAIRNDEADLLMKGDIATAALMKAVLNKEQGLNIGNLFSHVTIFAPEDHKFFAVTDAGINIAPNLAAKVKITNNAITLMRRLGVKKPRVAILSALEFVNPAIPSTVDAAVLAMMAQREQIKNAIIYGPISFDLAFDEHARKAKGVADIFPEDADIFVVPEIVCGNAICKALMYAAKYPIAGVVMGAKCPIILLSRADHTQERINSIILGMSTCITS